MSNCAPGRKARRARRWKTSSLEGPPPAASSGERRVGGVPQPFGAVRAPGLERDHGEAQAGQQHRVLDDAADRLRRQPPRSEEHTSELQSLMRISYAVFCLKKNKHNILPQILIS